MVTLIRYANEGFENHVQTYGIEGCYVFVRKAKNQALRYDKHLHPELQHMARNKDKKHTLKVSEDTMVYARKMPEIYLDKNGTYVKMSLDFETVKAGPFVLQKVKDIVDWQLRYEKLVKESIENVAQLIQSGHKSFPLTQFVEEYIAYEAIYYVSNEEAAYKEKSKI